MKYGTLDVEVFEGTVGQEDLPYLDPPWLTEHADELVVVFDHYDLDENAEWDRSQYAAKFSDLVDGLVHLWDEPADKPRTVAVEKAIRDLRMAITKIVSS